MREFSDTYGEWAIVTGASSGIGEQFAHTVAARGLKPLLVARRGDELARVAAAVEQATGQACETIVLDLADPGFIDALEARCAGREVGLVVGNAAFNPPARFLDAPRGELMRMIDVNDRANLLLAHAFLPPMTARRRGGLLLVGSVEGYVGVPWSATYAATKAFLLSFGEGLWGEYGEFGVDVLVASVGATDTPLLATRVMGESPIRPMDPREVADLALDNLGNGPVFVPGTANAEWVAMIGQSPRPKMVRTWGKMMRSITEATYAKLKGG